MPDLHPLNVEDEVAVNIDEGGSYGLYVRGTCVHISEDLAVVRQVAHKFLADCDMYEEDSQ